MKVREVMTTDVATTVPRANLARAARLMWEHDCGVLPVVDPTGRVAGMLTDRDICRAVTTADRLPSRIPVYEAASPHVFAAAPDDDVEVAVQTMKEHHVRRLPVVDQDGRLKGLLSMTDVVSRSAPAAAPVIVDALKAIATRKHVDIV